MQTIPKLLFAALCILACDAHNAFATNRYFSNITEESPSKKFKLEAVSPDNADEGNRYQAFQSSFVYAFRDVEKNEVLWTRKQPGDHTGINLLHNPGEEGSPVSLFVSDDGWTVIWTGASELVVVDITGKERGTVPLFLWKKEIVKNGFTKKENEEYVDWTTAGPRWASCSLWYFLDAGEQPLFVIRPWWGRRVILDLKSGSLIPETPDIAKQAALWEKNHILAALRRVGGPSSKPYSPDNWR